MVTTLIPRRRYELPRSPLGLFAKATWSGRVVDGPAVPVLEKVLRDVIGVPENSAWQSELTGSGRGALGVVLQALVVPAGSTIMLPSYTFVGVADYLDRLGYKIALADVSDVRPLIGLAEIERAWRPDVKCVVLTHLFGQMGPTRGLVEWIRGKGACVVEDCAHSIGSRDDNAPVGIAGDGAFFSFDVLKPVTTLGGGMALWRPNRSGANGAATPLPGEHRPRRRDVFGRLSNALFEDGLFRSWTLGPMSVALAHPRSRGLLAQAEKLVGRRSAPSGRMSNFQARVGLWSAHSLEHRLQKRREMARRVLAALELTDPQLEEDAAQRGNAYFVVVRAAPGATAGDMRWKLLGHGIDAGIGADVADDLGRTRSRFMAGANDWSRRAVQLPCGADYSEAEIQALCQRLRRFRGELLR